ncbi:MAG: hypothetical protein AB1430_11690 [Pseudomonadota bacterium]
MPTLTEVVQLAPPRPVQTLSDVLPAEPAPPPAAMPVDTSALVQGVLQDVQRQVDLMLEYRLREALGPLIARVSDTLIREARDELASTLRDVVARAVAQEIERQRAR